MKIFWNKNNKYLKILTLLSLAAVLILGIYQAEQKEVIISIDNKTRKVNTFQSTVGELLKSEKISLPKGSKINLKLNYKIDKDTTIVIKTPKTYVINMGGKTAEVQSVNNRVEDILKDLNYRLGELDYTYPALGEKIEPMEEIKIVRVEEKISTVKKELPFESIIKHTDKLEKGTTKVVQEGTNGLKEITVKSTFKDGKLSSQDTISESIVSQPIPRIVEKGSNDYFVSSRGAIRYTHSFVAVATAYDLSYESTGKNPGDNSYGLTALGTKARPGVVSVDPSIIPLGSKLYIESLDHTQDYGFAVAEDTGSAIKGNRVDLFFSSADDCKDFGRRKVRVYVLKK